MPEENSSPVNSKTAPDDSGIVFNIQHYTIHDGPGIRTEIFLKGCALKCKWCSNPESINVKPEVGLFNSQCIGFDKCGFCLKACPLCDQGVFFQFENRIVGIDRNTCNDCLLCVDACPADAIVAWGKEMSVKEVMSEVLDDIAFYEKSGGGVTISGGDPLIQWRFTLELLKQCKQNGIHTCLETELCCKPSILDELYPQTDLVITDIKHMNSSLHKEFTGVNNTLILKNIQKTAQVSKPLIIRIPIIPGFNDDRQNIKETAEFIDEVLNKKVLQVQLLPYRPLGLEKYESLGLEYPLKNLTSYDIQEQKKEMDFLVDLMRSFGIPAVSGSGEKIVNGPS